MTGDERSENPALIQHGKKSRGPTPKSQTPIDLHVCQIIEVVLGDPLDIEAELQHGVGQAPPAQRAVVLVVRTGAAGTQVGRG